MIEDYLSEPERQRSVENPDHSAEDGGGHRFMFFGSPGGRERRQKKKERPHIGAPVKLELSGDTLADDIVEMHSEEHMIKKVEEFTDKIKEEEHDRSEDCNETDD